MFISGGKKAILECQIITYKLYKIDKIFIRKYPDTGKDWRQEEKGKTEDEMVEWHHNSMDMSQAPGVGGGQGGLACCDSWGRKESDTTEWLNWTELKKGLMLKLKL